MKSVKSLRSFAKPRHMFAVHANGAHRSNTEKKSITLRRTVDFKLDSMNGQKGKQIDEFEYRSCICSRLGK